MTKVLVVEDEPKIADMERDFLEGSGYQPYVASDGKEALKIMDEVEIVLHFISVSSIYKLFAKILLFFQSGKRNWMKYK